MALHKLDISEINPQQVSHFPAIRLNVAALISLCRPLSFSLGTIQRSRPFLLEGQRGSTPSAPVSSLPALPNHFPGEGFNGYFRPKVWVLSSHTHPLTFSLPSSPSSPGFLSYMALAFPWSHIGFVAQRMMRKRFF